MSSPFRGSTTTRWLRLLADDTRPILTNSGSLERDRPAVVSARMIPLVSFNPRAFESCTCDFPGAWHVYPFGCLAENFAEIACERGKCVARLLVLSFHDARRRSCEICSISLKIRLCLRAVHSLLGGSSPFAQARANCPCSGQLRYEIIPTQQQSSIRRVEYYDATKVAF